MEQELRRQQRQLSRWSRRSRWTRWSRVSLRSCNRTSRNKAVHGFSKRKVAIPVCPSDPLGPGGPSSPGNPCGPSLPFWPIGPSGPWNTSNRPNEEGHFEASRSSPSTDRLAFRPDGSLNSSLSGLSLLSHFSFPSGGTQFSSVSFRSSPSAVSLFASNASLAHGSRIASLARLAWWSHVALERNEKMFHPHDGKILERKLPQVQVSHAVQEVLEVHGRLGRQELLSVRAVLGLPCRPCRQAVQSSLALLLGLQLRVCRVSR